MAVKQLRARQMVRCVVCKRMVSRANAELVPSGWVGGSCLQKALSAARNDSNTEVK